MISQRFAVEFDRRTVGVAVRFDGGFTFFASEEAFRPLDGRVFPTARSLERQLRRSARKDRFLGAFRPPAPLPA